MIYSVNCSIASVKIYGQSNILIILNGLFCYLLKGGLQLQQKSKPNLFLKVITKSVGFSALQEVPFSSMNSIVE